MEKVRRTICVGTIELRWTQSKGELQNEKVLPLGGFEPTTLRLEYPRSTKVPT